MLETYGLHELVWDACDERFSDMLVASPADAGGRGVLLAVREGGAAAGMTRATICLAWKNKVTGARGTEPFQAVDASAGTFTVFYPAAMCEAAGAVQAQVVVSRGDDTYISSRVFTTIDFRGFDPSTLTDLFYTFSGCSRLTTILADASWALPASGITGSQCFYSCSTSLVGGNGTAWASNKTAYTYFRIDTAGTPGYVTVV